MSKIEKYIGIYRVCCEFERNTLQPIKEDNWIQCSKSGQVYRIGGSILAYYRPTRGNSNQLCEELKELGIEGLENRSTDGDILIYFDEKYIKTILDKVGVITSGADIKPCSVKNLRKLSWFKKGKEKYIKLGLYKELSDEEKEVYRQRFQNNINSK